MEPITAILSTLGMLIIMGLFISLVVFLTRLRDREEANRRQAVRAAGGDAPSMRSL